MFTFALLHDSSDLHIYKDYYGENNSRLLPSNFIRGKEQRIVSHHQAKTTDGIINYRPYSAQNFEMTEDAGENLRPFSFCRSD